MDPVLYKFDEEGAAAETAVVNNLTLKLQDVVNAFIGLAGGLSLSLADLKFLMTISKPDNVFVTDGTLVIFLHRLLTGQRFYLPKRPLVQIAWEASILIGTISSKLLACQTLQRLPRLARMPMRLSNQALATIFLSQMEKQSILFLICLMLPANAVTLIAGTTDAINEAYKLYAVDVDQAARLTAVQAIATALNDTVALIPGGGLLGVLGDIGNFLQIDGVGELVPNPNFVETGLFESLIIRYGKKIILF